MKFRILIIYLLCALWFWCGMHYENRKINDSKPETVVVLSSLIWPVFVCINSGRITVDLYNFDAKETK